MWHISTVPFCTASSSLQAGDDLAGGEDLDLELVVGGFGDELGEDLGRAVDRVERLREARGQAPLDLRREL